MFQFLENLAVTVPTNLLHLLLGNPEQRFALLLLLRAVPQEPFAWTLIHFLNHRQQHFKIDLAPLFQALSLVSCRVETCHCPQSEREKLARPGAHAGTNKHSTAGQQTQVPNKSATGWSLVKAMVRFRVIIDFTIRCIQRFRTALDFWISPLLSLESALRP